MKEQNFEQYPELAEHISRMAVHGHTGSVADWSKFLSCLNAILQPEQIPSSCFIADDRNIPDGEYLCIIGASWAEIPKVLLREGGMWNEHLPVLRFALIRTLANSLP